jgi:RimJ/RimL family protein N-acetyltransferase
LKGSDSVERGGTTFSKKVVRKNEGKMMHTTSFDWQPILENEQVILYPLRENDFEGLYEVASDPLIWVQHPAHDRWKEDVFVHFFDEAIKSKGAFKIVAKANGEILGSTRIYNYDQAEKSILIGYTFYARKYWGTGINHAVKKLLLNYLFRSVSKVYFHIGISNFRSQISILRLGAEKVVCENEEVPATNFVYVLHKADWQNQTIEKR